MQAAAASMPLCRRASQALAHYSGVAIAIARELVAKKLLEQERTVRGVFKNASAAEIIAATRHELQTADTLDGLRVLEAQAALAYWTCWHALPIMFPKADLPRVPIHWRTFAARLGVHLFRSELNSTLLRKSSANCSNVSSTSCGIDRCERLTLTATPSSLG
jgi:hypothetical protein